MNGVSHIWKAISRIHILHHRAWCAISMCTHVLYVYTCFHTPFTCVHIWMRMNGVWTAKEPYKRDDILQKTPIILRNLVIAATPYNTYEWRRMRRDKGAPNMHSHLWHDSSIFVTWLDDMCDMNHWVAHACVVQRALQLLIRTCDMTPNKKGPGAISSIFELLPNRAVSTTPLSLFQIKKKAPRTAPLSKKRVLGGEGGVGGMEGKERLSHKYLSEFAHLSEGAGMRGRSQSRGVDLPGRYFQKLVPYSIWYTT